MGKKGFTLIELLVVISIIALLLAILMPALSMVKKKAKNVLCQNNLRQYALAGEMYLTESDEIYPRAWNSLFSSTPSGNCQWHDEENFLDKRPDLAGPLWPYLEMQGIHLCPTFLKIGKSYGVDHPGHGSSSPPVVPQYSYSMNAFLGPEASGSIGRASKRSQVKRPSDTFFFSEENMWITSGLNGYVLNDNALVVLWNATLPDDTSPQYVDSFGFFHNCTDLSKYSSKNLDWDDIKDADLGNVYAVFVDGHVEAVHTRDSYRLAKPR